MPAPIVRATDTTHEGCPLLTKTRTLVTDKGVQATIEWEVRNKDGSVFDLSDYICLDEDGDGEADNADAPAPLCGQVIFRFSDAVMPGVVYQIIGYSTDPVNGIVQCELSTDIVALPGVYIMEVGIAQQTEADTYRLVHIDRGLLSIERGLFGSVEQVGDFGGPPTMQELRIALRDSVIENNLLNDVEFDDSEILHAIVRPLRQWNETPPPVATYNGRNFPFHEHWLKASMALLMRSAAYWYERNRLAASHGGVTVDDRNKMQTYMLMANQLYQEWETFIINKKVEINVSLAYGVVSSPYNHNWY